MFVYEKQLQYPVKIKNTNPALAKLIITQYGGPDGELGASMRYLSQRFSMPLPELKATLTDIGTEVPMLRKNQCHLTRSISAFPFRILTCHVSGMPFNRMSIVLSL